MQEGKIKQMQEAPLLAKVFPQHAAFTVIKAKNHSL